MDDFVLIYDMGLRLYAVWIVPAGILFFLSAIVLSFLPDSTEPETPIRVRIVQLAGLGILSTGLHGISQDAYDRFKALRAPCQTVTGPVTRYREYVTRAGRYEAFDVQTVSFQVEDAYLLRSSFSDVGVVKPNSVVRICYAPVGSQKNAIVRLEIRRDSTEVPK